LLAISSDRALRWVGLPRWKWLQKSAVLVFWLTALHAFAFQLLEYRGQAAAATVFILVIVVVGRWRATR